MSSTSTRPGLIRRIFATMGSPSTVMARYVDDLGWPAALSVPLFAFALFFLQSGLDLYRAGTYDAVEVTGLAFGGAAIGLVLVPVLAVLAWILVLPFDRSRSLGWAVRAFALAYAPALIYGFCGLGANLIFGWNTAVAFGITGVLWAISPLFAALREMSGDRRRLSVMLATFVGLVVLAVWSAAVGG
ncbi:MAG: hypothetical protein GY906_09735 [bacterium]|nr:hypothetical protein [bacterium]